MSQNIREDIFQLNSEYALISLISSKIKVIVIGGGKAGLIKAKSFASKGFVVTVLSLEFAEEFNNLAEEYELKLIKAAYRSNYTDGYHIVVIAIKDISITEEIQNHCDSISKLYLTCHDFREGNFVMPTQGSSKNIVYSINTKVGSPITSMFLKEETKGFLSEFDDLVEYIGNLRRSLKESKNLKEIMRFTSSEDFHFFLKKGYADAIIKMFYIDI